jgi:hypothetical protein
LVQRDIKDENKPKSGTISALGLGVVTGAADDDPSAIGTYSSAGEPPRFSLLPAI